MATQNEPTNRQMMDDRDLDALYTIWRDAREQDASFSLKEWIERFPAYREQLLQWTTEAPLTAGADALPADAMAEARTLEIGRKVLAARKAARAPKPATPITSLYALAQQRGLTPKALASALEVGVPIVAKLQQRLLHYPSIPAQFLERLARTLQVNREQLQNYLLQPASLSPAAMYRSSATPVAGAREDFARAIAACPDMTAEQKQAWLAHTQDQAP